MAFQNGFGGDAKLGTDSISGIEDWSFDQSSQLLTASPKGTSQVQGKAGPVTATGSMTIFTDPSDTAGQGAISIGATLTNLNLYLDGDSTGDTYFTSTDAVVVSKSLTNPNDFSKITYQLHFNNGPTEQTVA